MAQEAPKPHILHLDSLASLIDFSVSLLFLLWRPEASTSSPLRLLRRSFVPRRRRHLRCMLLSDPCSSLSRSGCNLSLLRFPVTKTRSRLHRRSSSPAIALTAFTLENPAHGVDVSSPFHFQRFLATTPRLQIPCIDSFCLHPSFFKGNLLHSNSSSS
ncbi:hypothetical protein YC2023_081418 [Brassica napus]